MNYQTTLLAIFLMISGFSGVSQSDFNIHLEPITIPNLGGVQSFAVGQHDGKWLVVGGRVDGLHRRQPWASFDLAGHNDLLMVIDPALEQVWTSPLTDLPVEMQDQLKSTNMEFYQEDQRLYVIGGYGHSTALDDHTTFASLVAIEIPEVIDAIVNGTDISPYFRQIDHEEFAVTGGVLRKIDDMFYLVGGQRFEGVYNPMDMPTFTQEYTDAVRVFDLDDDGTEISVSFLEGYFDEELLHRRDFNVLAQIMPDGSEGLTAFSGVFQQDVDIPFLDCVNITDSGYEQQDGFSQYFNHYHCAHIPLYSASDEEMHSVFFGGIAQYYEEDGDLVMDNDVPFVKTIARVTRTSDGTMTEYKLPTEMPALLGSGAEFIRLESVSAYPNGVIEFDSLVGDSVLIGYIYGGIESSAQNIFWINDGTQSSANSNIFEVYLIEGGATGVHELNVQSQTSMRMQIFPNASSGLIYLDLMIKDSTDLQLQVIDLQGKVLFNDLYPGTNLSPGENQLTLHTDFITPGNMYVVRVSTNTESISQKMVVNE